MAGPCNELRTIDAVMQDCEHTLELHRSPELLISPKLVVRGAVQDLGSV